MNNDGAFSYSRRTISLVGACFILSGATGLIYEVLWARMLGLVFGATTLAVSTVLAAFMGGLAVGSALAARFGSRIRKPLSAYGWMEVGIALYALLVPYLFHWIDDLYALIWQASHPTYLVFSFWRFLLSSLILIIPTTLMGATLPVLAKAVLQASSHRATSVTRLYACNLGGAILGTLTAGFLLLPTLGISSTIIVAATINVLVGVTAMLAERSAAKRQYHTDAVDDIQPPESSPVIVDASFWLLAALASGFVTISMQVAWTRILTMIIGSSTYAFSIVVALFLIGLGLGAWIIGRTNLSGKLRTAILIVEVAITISLFFSLVLVNWTPGLLVSLGLRLQIGSWGGLLALQMLCASVLILLPATLMGMVMPLVLVWATADNLRAVALVGRSYAINTIGAIGGAFMAGFVLIPRTGTKFTLLLSAALCLVVAGSAYQAPLLSADPGLRRGLAAGITAVTIVILFVVAPPMNLADLSIGAYDSLIRVLAQSREGTTENGSKPDGPDAHKLLFYKEGPTSTVSVRRDLDTISMAINGRTNASDSIYDMPTQVMLAQVPILIAPRVNTGLVIGFATGVSAGAILQSPIESVTCVELEPATVDGSRYFEHVNNKPLLDQRMQLVIDDARTYLHVNPARYDIIVSEPSHPWVPGVANLFTQEFFETGRKRLNADGVFVQWLQIYQLSTDSLRSVLATYHSVFPHVMVFRVGGVSQGKDLILVGSNVPLSLDRISERMANARVAAELGRVNLKTTDDVKAWYVCDESRLATAVAGARINTDDNMHIETTVPREAFRPLSETNGEWIQRLAGKE